MSNLLGNSTTDVQFQKRIVDSTHEVSFLQGAVVELSKKLDFCVDHAFHGWHIAAGLDCHSNNLTLWEIRPLELEGTMLINWLVGTNFNFRTAWSNVPKG